MTTQHPLNPDALEAAAKALRDDHANRTEFYVVPAWEKTPHESKELFRAKANAAVSAYLAAALPEMTSVEELEKLPIMTVAMFTIPPLERRMPFELCTINREDKIWMQPGDGAGYRNYMMARYLPATVIYLPEVNP